MRLTGGDSIDTLDPHLTVQAASYPVVSAIFSPLVFVDPDGKVIPSLAQSWDVSSDGKSITFHIHKGAKFHDGTPVNAQAVKWNFDRMLDPKVASPRKAELTELNRTEVQDEYTVVLHLTRPFRPFMDVLATERPGYMVSPTAIQKYGDKFGSNPVGAGPFRFVEWVPDRLVRLERNKDYWKSGKPYLDAMVFQAVPDDAVALAMLRTGEIDRTGAASLRPENLPMVDSHPKLKALRYPRQQFQSLQFDVGRAPYNNKALRQAVGYAIDRETFVKVGLAGTGSPAYTIIGQGWAHNPEIKPFTFDLNKAREKLVEAGYPQGASMPIACQTTGDYFLFCEIYISMLAKAGIKLEAVSFSSRDYTGPGPQSCIRRVGMCVFGSSHRVDPHIHIQRMYQSNGYFGQVQNYNNPEVDRLIDEAATIFDIAKAKVLYDRIQRLTAEEAPIVFTAYRDQFWAMSKNVMGHIVLPTRHLVPMEEVWLAR